ncbi:hypothetical protein BD408DRAFT_412136 [Parasitella parasitica]|nr:hypothetical protein BD408DRAFT_412136 [Parasitella parasitica]
MDNKGYGQQQPPQYFSPPPQQSYSGPPQQSYSGPPQQSYSGQHYNQSQQQPYYSEQPQYHQTYTSQPPPNPFGCLVFLLCFGCYLLIDLNSLLHYNV